MRLFRLNKHWISLYQGKDLPGDLVAGLVVAIMLVPQSMAYASIAGLPPQVGLYACILPLILYGLSGSSNVLSVGPVAMVSLLVAAGLEPMVESFGFVPGTAEYLSRYLEMTLLLAMMVGLIQIVMGLLRLGLLVNYLSHTMLAGFTSAGALIIIASQLPALLGLSVPHFDQTYQSLFFIFTHTKESNLVTTAIGLSALVILLYFRTAMAQRLRSWGLSERLVLPFSKAAPLLVVLIGIILAWWLHLDRTANVNIVGSVPAGLPNLSIPPLQHLDWWEPLFTGALAISFIGFMESYSVAKSLASKRRERIHPNRELVALGIANIGSSLTGGYPVTGSFSRSAVNHAAGAHTGLASMITALLIICTVLFLTPVFYYLPHSILAAIIIAAATGLIDLETLQQAWLFRKIDAAEVLITFASVLIFGIKIGLLVGLALPNLLFLWRTNRPHFAIVGRLGKTESYRNEDYHQVKTYIHVLTIRIDENLCFANSKFLEETVLRLATNRPYIRHLVLICIAINFIDSSALETLKIIKKELDEMGVKFYLTEIKDQVRIGLEQAGFIDRIGRDRVYISTHELMVKLDSV